MRASNIQLRQGDGYCEIRAEVRCRTFKSTPFVLWYRFPEDFYDQMKEDCGDAFLAALLPTAMASGEQLEIDAEVCPQLLDSVSTAQEIYHSWNQSLLKVSVIAPRRTMRAASQSRRVGLFMSLGVDSFYSLLKKRDEQITDLLFIQSFDKRENEHDERRGDIQNRFHRVAKEFGKTAVPVTTNVREVGERFLPWGKLYHGAALASVALAAGINLRKVFVASSFAFHQLIPWGSHPLLDPLWSTDYLSIAHDGCEACRQEKLEFIGKCPVVQQSLRVCYNNANKEYNCGQCQKCLRTMIGLLLTGRLNEHRTFPILRTPVELDIECNSSYLFFDELLQAVRTAKPEVAPPELKSHLEHTIADAICRYEQSAIEDRRRLREFEAMKSHVIRMLANRHTILIDEDRVREEIPLSFTVWPFLERDGKFWGLPPNDATAVGELNRLREHGADQVLFVGPSFWWLDFYAGFRQHLENHFASTVRNEWVIGFDLRR